jgi:membrane-bound acyltransferase YfiQ involved in biofilm formation
MPLKRSLCHGLLIYCLVILVGFALGTWTNQEGNKWLLIISLVVGLSFGVHFMALLTIPAIGFLYFSKL